VRNERKRIEKSKRTVKILKVTERRWEKGGGTDQEKITV
jgi:hypothetical protein